MKKFLIAIIGLSIVFGNHNFAYAQMEPAQEPIFDDALLLNGYAEKYTQETTEILLAIIQDETVSAYKTAAAVRVLRAKHIQEVALREKRIIEKILLRRLNRTESPFVEVEIMHTLLAMDRYKYFDSMVPALIQKMDHYNRTVNELAYKGLDETVKTGTNRAREARLVFNTLRKVLFLSRKRLETTTKADDRLKQKLELVRWSIKILGTQELKRLPKEVLHLL